MPTLDDFDPGNRIMGCIVSDAGLGKSVALGSFPDPYFFDLDGRMAPLARFYPGKLIGYDTFTNQDYEKFDVRIEQLKAGTYHLQRAAQGSEPAIKVKPKTTIVDGLTSLAWTAIEYSISLRGSGKGAKTKKGIIEVAEIEDYGTEIKALNNLIDDLRKIDSHVFLTAHILSKVIRKLDGTETVIKTLLTAGSKIASALPAYFNEIWVIKYEPSIIKNQPGIRRVWFNGGGEGIECAKTALPLPDNIILPADGNLFRELDKILAPQGIILKR